MNLTITQRESKLIPWDCEIIFTSEMSYQSKAQQASGIRDEFDNRLWFPNRIILGESFNFYVVNKTILDDNGDYTFMDLVAQDYIDSSSVYDGEFNIANDRILVGQTDSLGNWEGTAFVIDFRNIDSEDYPPPGSRYSITWDRNFWGSDTFRFSVDSLKIVSEENFKNDLDKIRVVPNPYVGTNAMEEAVINPFLNQPRKIMFTNVPEDCVITIFTPSGVKVKTIRKNNFSGGMVQWDLLNEEGLEIAAGMYLYHIQPSLSNNTLNQYEHVGKFAVIK